MFALSLLPPNKLVVAHTASGGRNHTRLKYLDENSEKWFQLCFQL